MVHFGRPMMIIVVLVEVLVLCRDLENLGDEQKNMNKHRGYFIFCLSVRHQRENKS